MAKKKFSAGLTVLSCFLALVIGFAAAFFLYTYIKRPTGGDAYIKTIGLPVEFYKDLSPETAALAARTAAASVTGTCSSGGHTPPEKDTAGLWVAERSVRLVLKEPWS